MPPAKRKSSSERYRNKATCKKLYVRCPTIRVPGKISLADLPLLPNLELLSVSSVDPSELSLLRKLPRLRSIEVADSDFYTLTENNDTSAKAASLHELVQVPRDYYQSLNASLGPELRRRSNN